MGCQKRGTHARAGFLAWVEEPDNFVLPEDMQGHLYLHCCLSTAVGRAEGQADGSGASDRKFQGIWKAASTQQSNWIPGAGRAGLTTSAGESQEGKAIRVWGPPMEGVLMVLLQTLPTLSTFLGLLSCQAVAFKIPPHQAEVGWGLCML